MLVLSYGFKKPQTGDNGSVFFPALEFTIQQLNDHTHNGTNSAMLTAASSTVVTQNIPAGSWALVATFSSTEAHYRQLVTLPLPITNLANVMVSIKGDPDGSVYLLGVEKVSATTFYVYTNDNTKSFKAVFTS